MNNSSISGGAKERHHFGAKEEVEKYTKEMRMYGKMVIASGVDDNRKKNKYFVDVK